MSFADLSVVGLGLVSPVAATAREHVFFIRAEAGMTAARAFVDSAGEPLDVLHCQLIDPTQPMRTRLAMLGHMALEDGLSNITTRAQVVAHLCGPTPWEGFSAEDGTACEAAWSQSHGLTFRQRFVGAAGVYQALAGATDEIARGASAVVVVALDSFACPAAIAARLHPPSRWEPIPPRLSEAAAVIVVTSRQLAAELPLRFGRVVYAGCAQGTSSDLDDEPVDGRALTALVRHAGSGVPVPIVHAFGPTSVDNLRRRSWEHAFVRNRHLISLAMQEHCVEHSIGRVGAAAGGAHLVYALASQHHRTLEGDGTIVTWAVSRDGARGLGVVQP